MWREFASGKLAPVTDAARTIEAHHPLSEANTDELRDLVHEVKRKAHALYGFSGATADHFEGIKDEPNLLFLGLTPRQAYINVSELLMKPSHGEGIFGELLAETIRRHIDIGCEGPFIVTHSGFQTEAEVLIKRFGADAVALIRISRTGCHFDGDSRAPVYLDLPSLDVVNNELPLLWPSVREFVLRHLSEAA